MQPGCGGDKARALHRKQRHARRAKSKPQTVQEKVLLNQKHARIDFSHSGAPRKERGRLTMIFRF